MPSAKALNSEVFLRLNNIAYFVELLISSSISAITS